MSQRMKGYFVQAIGYILVEAKLINQLCELERNNFGTQWGASF